jgi:iron complex outermembrane receptor protein
MTETLISRSVPQAWVPHQHLERKMTETILSRSLRRLFAGGAAAGLALLALPAAAQDDQPQPVQRVEITGSSIRRLAAESSLPVTTLRASDFIKQGLTTAQEVLNTIPMNQSATVTASAVGAGTGGRSVADMRALGPGKTLVLLNGRRLATHPYFADAVDLNIIPLAALERIEVLRDGASAIYGSDAIGGVINFITKRSIKGGALVLEGYEPQRSGGGNEQRVNLSGGYGDLSRDGYSMFGVIDWHQQSELNAVDRRFSATGIRPQNGLRQTSRTTFPANFFSTAGVAGNPFFPACRPSATVPAIDGSPVCEFDFTQFIDDIPKTTQFDAMAKFNKKFGEHVASVEFMHGRHTTESRVAPAPFTNIGVTMTAASPFYPGRGAVPAFPGLTGEPLDISWRSVEAGRRDNFDSSTQDRGLASLEGNLYGWDYNTALYHSQGKARSSFIGGYLVDQRVIDGVGTGILNPFGPQTPAGLAFLNDSVLIGKYLQARVLSTVWDGRVTRDLTQLPAGPLGFALGLEARHDNATFVVDRSLAGQSSSSGFADAQDQTGSRSIYAIFTELNAPVIKNLEVNLAVRFDHYTDAGSRVNPKVAVRYQPIREVLLRGSYNRGFRAPTLYDLFGPQSVTNTSNTWDDPRLCPGGVAVAGANPNVVCGQQQMIRQGGNPNLMPERSKTWSVGLVYEPTPSLTMSADWWDVKVENQIQPLAEQVIFTNFPKFQNLFVYDSPSNPTRLLFVIDTTSNQGELRTRGLDLSLLYRLPRNPFGTVSVRADGTYVNRYLFQTERGGSFFENAGRFAQNAPIFRWRHNLLLTVASGDWVYNLANTYSSHYNDQNTAVAPEFFNKVRHWSTWTLSATYAANKQLELTAGIRNLLDAQPPFSNQVTNFQLGYDPRFTDPLMRTFYARLTYTFGR